MVSKKRGKWISQNNLDESRNSYVIEFIRRVVDKFMLTKMHRNVLSLIHAHLIL